MIDPGWMGVVLASVLMAVVTAVALWAGVNLLRQNLIATARASVQLVSVGLILGWVFGLQSPLGVVGVLLIMASIAGFTAGRRLELKLRGIGFTFTLLFAVVTAATLLWVTRVAIEVPGLSARYFIPLGGIVLGNAMTAGTLAAARFMDDLGSQRERVETALALGASPRVASRFAFRKAFVAAVTPITNAMLIVGVVKLPGIMTGQMLGGADPFVAAKYQLVVLFMLAFGDGITALGVLVVLRRRLFTSAWQPRI